MGPTVSERLAVLDMIRKMESLLDRKMDEDQKQKEIIPAVDSLINEIDQVLFPGNKISQIYHLDCQECEIANFESSFCTWKGYIAEIIEKTLQCKDEVEADFEILMTYMEHVTLEELQQLLRDNLEEIRQENPQLYRGLILVYESYNYFWGRLNPEEGVFDLIDQRAGALKEHVDEWRWLFEELCDKRSKRALYNILENWITFQPEYIEKDSAFNDYFDLDLIPEVAEDEVFVDLGGYVGDTVEGYINAYSGKYGKIYTYEINPQNLERLKEAVKRYPDVVIKENAVGEKEGTMYINTDIEGSSTTLALQGEYKVTVVSLDEDIKEKITWLKMDIEGSEQSALRGARRHIEEEKPKLTICTYHNNEDIWKIPKMVKEYNPEYKLYFRYYGEGSYPSEYVLFAL